MATYRITSEGIELMIDVCGKTKDNKTLCKIYSTNGYLLSEKEYTEEELEKIIKKG